jgi:hypothetical protein
MTNKNNKEIARSLNFYLKILVDLGKVGDILKLLSSKG